MESIKMLDGKISIHAEMGSRERRVVIFIEDELSTLEILQIEMDMADFGNAITGHGHIPMKFILQDTSKVGKKHEVKTEEVTFNRHNPGGAVLDEEINRAIHEYEVDGWIGNRKDAKNWHHRLARKDSEETITYKINFHRWIDLPEK